MGVDIERAKGMIVQAFGEVPDRGVVLGSGFQAVMTLMEEEARLSFAEIPGFPATSVPGHEGAFIVGRVGSQRILFVSGRLHFYEGHSMETVTLPIRALAACGVRSVLLTNAAGGINPAYRVGDLMCLTDHINFMGANPLRGHSGKGGEGFVDVSQLYSPAMNRLLMRLASANEITIHEGIYIAVSGPSFETPAEIRMFAQWGADAVGMSTVPEAIAAQQAGMKVGAVSFITNLAAGRHEGPIRHEDVIDALDQSSQRLAHLLKAFFDAWGE